MSRVCLRHEIEKVWAEKRDRERKLRVGEGCVVFIDVYWLVQYVCVFLFRYHLAGCVCV